MYIILKGEHKNEKESTHQDQKQKGLHPC
jgi:hypothetical protein